MRAWAGLGRTAAIVGVFFGFLPPGQAETSPEENPASFSQLYFGLQPPADRDSQSLLDLIEELFAADRYGEAAPLVERLAGQPADPSGDASPSLKQRLTDAVQGLPAKGRETIESVLGGEYRARLQAANDSAALHDLIAAWPPELFGDEALVRFAYAEAAHGSPGWAARALRLAREITEASGGSIPEWRRRREAVNWLRAGEQRLAEALLPDAESLLEPAHSPTSRDDSSVPPSGWRLWTAPIEPAGAGDAYEPAGDVAVATVPDAVLVASGNTLHALGAASGRLLWSKPLAVDQGESGWRRIVARQRLPTNEITTDGRAAYVVAASHDRRISIPKSLSALRGAAWRRGPDADEATNRLVALDVAAGGKLVWAIDGADPDTDLSGAAFLGPPTVAGSRLFALASLDQTICLVEIDAGGGAVRWVQPLVRFQQAAPPRVAAIAASPVVGDRLVYCPTGRGAVAAVDPLRRRVAWVHYVRVGAGDQAPNRQQVWQGFGGGDLGSWENDDVAWRRVQAIEADGRLVAVSPAASTLDVLDIATGDPLWSQTLENGQSLAAVADGAVWVVETGALSAWRLDTGEQLGSAPFEDDSPAGRGVVRGQALYLPMRSGRFAGVRLNGGGPPSIDWTRTHAGPLESPEPLGDLVTADGAFFTCSATAVQRWPSASQSTDAPPESRTVDDWRRRHEAAPNDRYVAARYAAALVAAADNGAVDPYAAADELTRIDTGPRATAHAEVLRIEAAPDSETATAAARRLVDTPAAECVLRRAGGLELRAGRIAMTVLDRAAPTRGEAPDAPETAQATDRWSTHRVEADIDIQPETTYINPTSRRLRSNRQPHPTPLPLIVRDPQRGAPTRWLLSTRDNRTVIVGANGLGEQTFAELLPGDAPNRRSDRTPEAGEPHDALWRDLLVVQLEEGYAVYRVACGSNPAAEPQGLVWTSRAASQSDWPSPSAENPTPERPVAVGPWGVVAVSDGLLVCRDRQTGRLAWRRPTGRRGQAVRVLAVDDQLLVATADDAAVRLAAWTGEQLDAWSPPPLRSWVAQSGGCLLLHEKDARSQRFAVVSLRTAGPERVWEKEAAETAVADLADGRWLSLLEPDTTLTTVDIATGEALFETELPAIGQSPVRDLRTRRLGERLLYEVDRGTAMLDQARGAAPIGVEPLLTGELHCLDARTGESVWAAPVVVDRMAVLETSLADPPVLLLARGAVQTGEDNESPPNLVLAVLDTRTGATLLRRDGLPVDRPQNHPAAWALYERSSAERLVARVGRVAVTLQTTDRPAPPRPPMDARVEDPESSRRPDLKDLEEGVDRLFQWIDDPQQ